MSNYTPYSLPRQKLANSKKDKYWGKQCVDSIQSMSSSTIHNGRTSKFNKQVNFDLYNSRFTEDDFDYVLDPYGVNKQLGHGTPAKIQNYNIIRSKVELLKGEEIKRPFNFKVVATNGESVTTKQKLLRQKMLEFLQMKIMVDAGQMSPEELEEQTPESVKKYFENKYIDPREVTANQVLQFLVRKEKLQWVFNLGFENALIGAEEVYYVGISNGEPSVRAVNILNFEFDKTPGNNSIEDAMWAREERWMSGSQILDEYGEYMTELEIERLDKGSISGNSYRGMQHSFVYNPDQFYRGADTYNSQTHILVTNVVWKSMEKIGFLSYFNPDTNEIEETVVGDNFTMTEELKKFGAEVDWKWITQVWEGTKIGNDIYVNIRPLPNQIRDFNYSNAKLPYVGAIYSSNNSQATSIVDLIKPHQYTYIIVWWRLEQELAKAKGRKFIMDMAMLPKSQGWSVDQWMYYFDNMGVAWINSLEEGRPGDPNTVSKFNQFTSIDMTLSQSVGQYMDILSKLEDMVGQICGISKQRESSISASETLGGVEKAINQSSHITESIFYMHNEVKEKVLTQLLEVAKIAYADGKQIQHIVDDAYVSLINVDEDLLDSEYGIFLSNSSKDQQTKDKLESLAQVALQQDKANLSDIITILKSNSINEIESKIRMGEENKFARDAQSQQQQLESNERVAQMQDERERAKMENENINKQLDRENQLAIAQMKAAGSVGFNTPDADANGVPDFMELGKLSLEQSKASFEQSIKNKDLDVKKKQGDKKLQLEEEKLKIEREKIAAQERMNKDNNKTALKNKVVGERKK